MTTSAFASKSDLEVLQAFVATLDELKTRGLIRTANNPVSDYTEWLVAQKLGLQLRGNSSSGFDAVSPDGTKYQIKGRRVRGPQHRSIQLSALRKLDSRPFDTLIAVVFEPDFTIRHALSIPYEVVRQHSTFQSHTNAHRFVIRHAVLADSRITDLRNQF